MKRAGLLLILALAACRREDQPAPPQPQQRPAPPTQPAASLLTDAADRENLLNIAHGGTVVSRTGEATLKNSPVQAIIGDRGASGFWSSPPHDPLQSIVFGLPSRTTLTKIGAQQGGTGVKSLRFEASLDGATFNDLSTVKLAANREAQMFDVAPTEAAYLRVSTLDADQTFTGFAAIHARGTALEPAKPGSLDGCWQMDVDSAAMHQQGAYVFGSVAETNSALLLDGGSDGHFYRFVWIKGQQYGVAAIGVSPDGQHLSGAKWHEEAETLFLSTSWMGTKAPTCAGRPTVSEAVFRFYLETQGRYPMYGLLFDAQGNLVESESAAVLDRIAKLKSVRYLGNELGQPDAARNRAVAQRKLDTLRAALEKRGVDVSGLEFVNRGSEQPHRDADTEATRSLYGAVEIELRR